MDAGSAFVKCSISRGAFSGERVFDLRLADGANYVGIAPKDACFFDGRVITQDEPKAGEVLTGAMKAHLVRNGGNNADILIPDGEFVTVSADLVTR